MTSCVLTFISHSRTEPVLPLKHIAYRTVFNCLRKLPPQVRNARGWWGVSAWYVFLTPLPSLTATTAAAKGREGRREGTTTAVAGGDSGGGHQPYFVYCRQVRVTGQSQLLLPLAVLDVNKKGGLRVLNRRPDGQHLLNENGSVAAPDGGEPSRFEFFVGDAEGKPLDVTGASGWTYRLGVHLVKLRPPQKALYTFV